MTLRERRVAVVQMVSTADVPANLRAAAGLIAEAAAAGASMVALPENFAVLDGGPLAQFAELAGDTQAPLQAFLAAQARAHGIYLLAGTIPLRSRPIEPDAEIPELIEDGRVRPASLLYDPEGMCIARYDKMHLFDVTVDDRQANYSESRSFEPGDRVVAVDTPIARIGMSICYDLRFPELYRQLAGMDCELITVPSAFTQVTGAAHWEVLLRARAIENQCYVLAPNQGGIHNETRETYGHSMIVDPWGTVLARVEKGEGIATAVLDLEWMHDLRHRMPVAKHRRL